VSSWEEAAVPTRCCLNTMELPGEIVDDGRDDDVNSIDEKMSAPGVSLTLYSLTEIQ
jgi:hypothetical protein